MCISRAETKKITLLFVLVLIKLSRLFLPVSYCSGLYYIAYSRLYALNKKWAGPHSLTCVISRQCQVLVRGGTAHESPVTHWLPILSSEDCNIHGSSSFPGTCSKNIPYVLLNCSQRWWLMPTVGFVAINNVFNLGLNIWPRRFFFKKRAWFCWGLLTSP